MTTIVFLVDKSDLFMGFKMIGHAGYNTNGPDILCSALSATSQMTVNGIIDALKNTKYKDDVIVAEMSNIGTLYLTLANGAHKSAVVQQLIKSFMMFVTGLMNADEYHNFVRVEKEGGHKRDNTD